MLNRLTDQHAVKRIAVNRWKFCQMSNSVFIKRQTFNEMTLPLDWQIGFSRLALEGATSQFVV